MLLLRVSEGRYFQIPAVRNHNRRSSCRHCWEKVGSTAVRRGRLGEEEGMWKLDRIDRRDRGSSVVPRARTGTSV